MRHAMKYRVLSSLHPRGNYQLRLTNVDVIDETEVAQSKIMGSIKD